MLVLNLPFKALMFLTLMRPSLVLFLVLWLKLVKDFLKVRCRLALLPFLISCLIWLDLVASLPLIKERILVKIGRAVQQECRDRAGMPSSAWKEKGPVPTVRSVPAVVSNEAGAPARSHG